MIEMICGTYGHYINGHVVARTKDSGPFDTAPEREAELVALGFARYVDYNDAPIGFDETPPEPVEDATPVPEYSTENTAKELREIGKVCGLNFKIGMSKAEMVEALDAFFDATMTDEEPEGEPDDGETAPAFDATEAVL